jgi:hypothetical protein
MKLLTLIIALSATIVAGSPAIMKRDTDCGHCHDMYNFCTKVSSFHYATKYKVGC